MDRTDLKEKIIILGFTTAIFLPIRLLVGQYLIQHWFGTLGIASIVSIVLMVLVKKEKLGRLGQIFQRQMTKSLWSRSAKIIIITLMVFCAYFGVTILLVDQGNTTYHNDKEIIAKNFAVRGHERDATVKLAGPKIHDFGILGLAQVQYVEYIFAISYAMLNDATEGLLVNLHLILFIEQIEILGLLWFYRKAFRPQTIPR